MPERNQRRAGLAVAGALLALAAVAGPAAAPAAAASGVPSGGPARGPSGAPATASSAGVRPRPTCRRPSAGRCRRPPGRDRQRRPGCRGCLACTLLGVRSIPDEAPAGARPIAPPRRYLPASTLKVLTAITLIPLLNRMPWSSPASWPPRPCRTSSACWGTLNQASALFTALLTISANDAAIALTQAAGLMGRAWR